MNIAGSNLNILDDPSIHRLLESIISVAREWPSRRLGALTLAVWSLAIGISLRELLLYRHRRAWKEDNLAVRRLGHSLHSFEVSDLHSWSRAQNIGGLPHQLGALNLGAGSDDFGFSNTLALGSHRERVLELGAEDDVLDEHGLDLDAPA